MVYKLKKKLSSFELTMIAVGGAMGSGLFLFSMFLPDLRVQSVAITYLVCLFLLFVITRALSEMSVDYPTCGSYIEYANIHINRSVGFITGWFSIFSLVCVSTVITIIAGNILSFYFSWRPLVIYPLIIAFFAAINLMKISIFARIQTIITVVKIIFLIFMLFTIYVHTHGQISEHLTSIFLSHARNMVPYIGGFSGTLIGISVAFLGIDYVSIAGGEARTPSKNLPFAFKVTFIFIAISAAMVILISYTHANIINQQPEVTAYFFQHHLLHHIFDVLFLVSGVSVINTSIYASSRLLLNLTKNKFAPKMLGTTSDSGTPVNAVLFIAFFIIVTTSILFVWLQINYIIIFTLSYITMSIMVNWFVILFSYLNYYRNLIDISRNNSRMKAPSNSLYLLAILSLLLMIAVLIILILAPNLQYIILFMVCFAVILFFLYSLLDYRRFNKN